MNQSGLQEEMLKNYIENIFNRYDTDRSGTLDTHEMTFFFNDLFKALNINMTITDQDSMNAIRSIDQNNDGSVSKEELFLAFKGMLNQQYPSINSGPSRAHHRVNRAATVSNRAATVNNREDMANSRGITSNRDTTRAATTSRVATTSKEGITNKGDTIISKEGTTRAGTGSPRCNRADKWGEATEGATSNRAGTSSKEAISSREGIPNSSRAATNSSREAIHRNSRADT